jgi:hypothetical protein
MGVVTPAKLNSGTNVTIPLEGSRVQVPSPGIVMVVEKQSGGV